MDDAYSQCTYRMNTMHAERHKCPHCDEHFCPDHIDYVFGHVCERAHAAKMDQLEELETKLKLGSTPPQHGVLDRI